MRQVFVLGDSISIHYGPYLRNLLEGKLGYDRKRGEAEALQDLNTPVGANGGDSRMVLEYLTGEAERGVRYDILLLNCGLHDIKTDPVAGTKQVPPDEYETNLHRIAAVAKRMAQEIVWVRSTPVFEDIHNAKMQKFHRFHGDLEAYNAIADDVMNHHRIRLLDLYHFTLRLGPDVFCDHVHYHEWVRERHAAYIAGYLSALV